MSLLGIALSIGDLKDPAWDGITPNPSLIALAKAMYTRAPGLGQKAASGSTSVVPASDAIFPLGASESHIGEAGGKLAFVGVDFTRPADTSTYAVKDVVCNSTGAPAVISFAGAGRVNGETAYIVKARLVTNQKTNVATYRLWLYNAAPTPIADNAPYTLLWADRANRIGSIDFAALSTEDATNSDCAESMVADIRLPFSCAGGSNTIYGILETTSGFTPTSGQGFHVALSFDQN